jgi:hypothetical protein
VTPFCGRKSSGGAHCEVVTVAENWLILVRMAWVPTSVWTGGKGGGRGGGEGAVLQAWR